MRNIKKSYWDNFNDKLLLKINKFRKGESKGMYYRGNKELDKACKNRLKDFKHEKLTMTDVIEAGKTQFAFNALTARGAVMIISRTETKISGAAKIALREEDQFPDFIDFIKEECYEGKKKVLINIYGLDVIEAILNYK